MNDIQSRKLTRLEELEINEQFQRLPEEKKMILIAGEKILEMDFYFKNFVKKLLAQKKIQAEKINENFSIELLQIVEEKIKNNENFKKNELLELIDQRYQEELLILESKQKFKTQEMIKNIDQSFNEALQRVENLSQFQILAKQDIRKNQDKIYILEEQLIKEKEENEYFKKQLNETLEKNDLILSKISAFDDYNFNNKNFSSFNNELKEFIKKEAHSIAQNEIEKYLHDKDLFENEVSQPETSNNSDFFSENDNRIYELKRIQQLNDSKLKKLEDLINSQNEKILLLAEERRELILNLSELIGNQKIKKNKEILDILRTTDFSEVLENNTLNKVPINQDNIQLNLQKQNLIKNPQYHLNKSEINNNDSEWFKNAIFKNENLSDNNFLNEENLIRNICGFGPEKFLNYKGFQEKKQINLINNDMIINNDQFVLFDENIDMSKYNYYDGKSPIPGTKITRVNNYKNESSFDDHEFQISKSDFSEKLIEADSVNLFNLNKNNGELELIKENWKESNEKINNLESIIEEQSQELNKLKNISSKKPDELVFDDSTEKHILDSLEQALSEIKKLSSIQARTVENLEKQSKELDELKEQTKIEKITEAISLHNSINKSESNVVIENKVINDDYYFELRKIEEERKKIQDALELERIRLINEINYGKEKLSNLNESHNENVEVSEKNVEKPNPITTPKNHTTEEIIILESPKKKRKQQIFYEIKIHDKPKLTRADIDK